jgi:eukaryotic-like serine/threonine-protein kinase
MGCGGQAPNYMRADDTRHIIRPTDAVSLAAGARLGAYEVLSLVGAGGMGEVYRARDTRLGRTVALKVLSPHVASDETARHRLLREARAVSSIDHPNICALYDVGEGNGIDYLVMQFLDGITLSARLRRDGALPVDVAVGYARDIVTALAAAHAHGIIHRDLKPGNVMVTPAGAKLMDFGLAIPWSQPGADDTPSERPTQSVITRPGSVLGTLPYIAPEQLEGDPADQRSDIFSFGALFYEMLTGRRAFAASAGAGVMTQILGTMPPPPSRANRNVSAALDKVVMRCLAKSPQQRWQRAEDVLAAIDDAMRPGAGGRRSLAYAAAALGLVAIGSLAAAILAPSSRDASPPSAAAPADNVVVLAILPFEVDAPDAAERAYWAGLTQTISTRIARISPEHRVYVATGADVARRRVTTPEEGRTELGATRAIRTRTTLKAEPAKTTVEMVDTSNRSVVRQAEIAVNRQDPARFQNEVIAAILTLLDVSLTPAERARVLVPEAAPGAYELYLQAVGYFEGYFRDQNIDTAISLLQQAVKINPDYAAAHAALGRAYWFKYLTDNKAPLAEAARQSCERALGLDEADATPHACLGTVNTGIGRYKEAIEEFNHAMERDPGNEEVYLGLADAYLKNGNAAKAEETYKVAISLRADYAAAYSRLGVFYYSTGQYARAEEMFTHVTTLAPDSWRGFANLGGVLHVQGKVPEAIRAYRRSLEIKANDQAASNLGTVYFLETREYRKAADAYRQATRLSANDHTLWGNLAAVLRWAGDDAAARPPYARAIQLAESRRAVNPRDAAVLVHLAEYRAATGDRETARTMLAEGLRLAPRSPALQFEAALTYAYWFDDRDTALELLRKALEGGHPWRALERSPSLDRLRGDSRFNDLRRHIPRQAAATKEG